MILAGVLGRSVFEAIEKPLSARKLGNKLKLEEKNFKLKKHSVLAVPSEGKLIVTDASSTDFQGFRQMDLTESLNQKNFLEECKYKFSKAREKFPEEIIIVKLRPVSDNDEPSDDAINKLLLVIDEHQKSNPSSRLMIATEGDRCLYERILNLKINHDAKKVCLFDTSSLTPMDLLMIPAHGDEFVKLDPIDEQKLKKFQTQFDNVWLYITDQPQMIQSDLSVVSSVTLSRNTQNPDDKPSSAGMLAWQISEESEISERGIAFKREKELASTKSTLYAARFPTMDLPVERLIVFESLRGQKTAASSGYEESIEQIKSFYLEKLRKERGRVVIQSPRRDYACEGLRRAVKELREKEEGPNEIIITSTRDDIFFLKSFNRQSSPDLLSNVIHTHEI